MCNQSCVQFIDANIEVEEIVDKRILEVGSMYVNGSVRQLIEQLQPSSYIGVDIFHGPGVDEICDILELKKHFGIEKFDVVISTEVIEHVRDWRNAISNLKAILKPGGILLITTRSKGFPYHGHPFDFWRYEVDDINNIFADMIVEIIEKDPLSPGVFFKVRKPRQNFFLENNLSNYELYSVVKFRRCKDLGDFDIFIGRFIWLSYRKVSVILPTVVRKMLKKLFTK